MHSSPASHRGTRFSGPQQGVSIPPRRSTQPHPQRSHCTSMRDRVNYEHSRIPQSVSSHIYPTLILFQSSPPNRNSRPRCHWCPPYPSGSLYSLCSVLTNVGMDCIDMSSKLSSWPVGSHPFCQSTPLESLGCDSHTQPNLGSGFTLQSPITGCWGHELALPLPVPMLL